MKIVVCGGGTVGHIAPILAVVEALRAYDQKASILFVGSGTDLERELVADYQLEHRVVSSGKFRRYGRGWHIELMDFSTHRKNLTDFTRFSRGLLQARRIITKFKPDVVFCKGGYVTVPMGIAAKAKKIPLVIHESDSIFGLANRMLSRRAQKIAVGFPVETFENFPYPNKLVFTGNPVRAQLMGIDPVLARQRLGINTRLPILLVFGGSQGSSALNEVIFDGLQQLAQKYFVLHQTGAYGIEQARFLRHNLTPEIAANYRPEEFFHDSMGDALSSADMVLARSSAGSIADIAANAKPAILVPNQHSAGGHQQRNAEILARAGAIRTIDETQLTAIGLRAEVDRLWADKQAREYLAQTIAGYWRPDSGQLIAKLIIQAGQDGQR